MTVHTTNYFDTLILVSPDTRATAARASDKPGSIADLQYRMMAEAPYRHTSDDVIFSVHAARAGVAEPDRPHAGAEFFSRGQACLRSSPLVRSHGWGVHADADGRVALIAMESPQYAALAASPDVRKVAGMRAARAKP